jgi:hypothetical protein
MIDVEETYWKVREYTDEAKGIAFDTCHKIYVLMDDEQVALQRSYGYGENDEGLFTSDEMTGDEMKKQVISWYQQSCGLRFISAVSTNPKFGDNGWFEIISQFEGLDDDWDDEDE